MAYLMYLRKSRADLEAEARGEGETLARHKAALLAAAKLWKLPEPTIYSEIQSGENIVSRPVMQQLLEEVSQGNWQGVLVMEVERLARGDTIDQGLVAQAFKLSGTKIITPAKIYDPSNEFDEEYFEFGLYMSRREYKTINRRLQRGRVASVNEGKYVGNIPPYGYERVKLQQQKGWTLAPVPAEAEIVQLIFRLYTEGISDEHGHKTQIGLNKIANKLNAMQIPSRTGRRWEASPIRDILSNPVYIGKVRWNRRPCVKKSVNGEIVSSRPRNKDFLLVDGLHEPIIAMPQWEHAQEMTRQNRPTQFNSQLSIKNPLASLVICGMCGRSMVRRPYQADYPDGLICANTHCPNISSQLVLVQKRVKEALADWLKNYELPANVQAAEQSGAEPSVHAKMERRLISEIATLDTQLSKTYDLLEQGIYTPEVFAQRCKSVTERKTEAVKQLKQIQLELENERNEFTIYQKLVPKVENILAIYDHTDDAGMLNKLLKEVVSKIVYTKTEGGRWKPEAMDSFQLDLFMKLPK